MESGERGIYSGVPLQDFLFYFRRVNNNLHFVLRIEFRTRPGDPQARALNRSLSSVLYSLPIKSIDQKRQTILIDLGNLLLTDLPLSSLLSSLLEASFKLDETKSYFGSALFPLNMEIRSTVLN